MIIIPPGGKPRPVNPLLLHFDMRHFSKFSGSCDVFNWLEHRFAPQFQRVWKKTLQFPVTRSHIAEPEGHTYWRSMTNAQPQNQKWETLQKMQTLTNRFAQQHHHSTMTSNLEFCCTQGTRVRAHILYNPSDLISTTDWWAKRAAKRDCQMHPMLAQTCHWNHCDKQPWP